MILVLLLLVLMIIARLAIIEYKTPENKVIFEHWT